LVGAKPVFVDAESATGNIDIDQIEAAITPNTRALSLVHYLGMPVDMDRINATAKKHGLFVVEDCALAIGSLFKGIHAGLHGDIGLFSFYPVKHMTTLEGGMALSKHPDVLAKLTRQRAFGVDRSHRERAIPGQYDVDCLGFNYRMNELQAAVGVHQVRRLDSFLAARKENYETMADLLRELPEIALLQSTHGDFVSSYYCQSIVLQGPLAAKRFEFVEAMTAAGVGTSIYYPRPVPEFTYYRQKYGSAAGEFPNAANIANASVALPVGPHLKPGDAAYIAKTVKETIQKLK
jgi:dTDP-4-amino-4,6-dideoxygalactose transaminase